MSDRIQGTVKWFNSVKGFGFISPSDGGEDLFVHQTSIKAEGFRSLGEGEAVEYSVQVGEDGRTKAVDVTGPNGGEPQGAPRRSNPNRRYDDNYSSSNNTYNAGSGSNNPRQFRSNYDQNYYNGQGARGDQGGFN